MIESDVQKLNPGAKIDLFELDSSHAGGDILRWYAGLLPTGNVVTWQGEVYANYPVTAEGFEKTGKGSIPRPTLRTGNIAGLFGAYVRSFNDLVNSKLTRRRTLVKYLDAVNFPGGVNPLADPTAHFPDEIWFLDRKSAENGAIVEFELAAAFDVQGVMIPRRQCIQNVCTWEYRGPECGYVGGAVSDKNDIPTTDLSVDDCGRRLNSCKQRFGATSPLTYGGMPGVGLIR